MNRRAICVIVTACVIGATALTAQSVTAQLGITDGRAREAVFDSFVSGAVSIAGKAEVFTAASPPARVAIVNAAATLARAFVDSDEFLRRYADHREANGPDPLPPVTSADEVLAQQRSNFEAQVEGMRKQFIEVTPEQRETLEKGFDAVRARFDEMDKSGTRAELDVALRAQRTRQVQAHETAMKELETLYPADPRALVANRLRRFLDLSKDVDFKAQVAEKDKRMHFVEPSLEAKPAEWKMLFRAGKPATDAARAFAQKWLADLAGKGVERGR
jgi:hypothetical protein